MATSPPTTTRREPRMSRRRAFELFRLVLAVLVVTGVGYALAANWSAVTGELRRAHPGALALSFGLALLAPILTLMGWRRLLADLGTPLHLAPASGIFFIGQLGKYLPGSVWSVLAQAEMGARLRIPRRRSGVVGLISIGMAAATGLLVGLPSLPILVSREATSGLWVSVLLMVPILVVLFSPRLLNWFIAVGLRLLRRDPLEHRLSGRAIVETVGWFILAWCSTGAHLMVLTRSIGAGSLSARDLVLGAGCGYCLAAVLGMASFLLPAGVGVREGLLVLILSPFLDAAGAAAVVVLSRFLLTVGDLFWALVGFSWARSHHLLTTRAERHAAGGAGKIDSAAGSG
jgi:uncharacterized membrane protein YbhN (UPF0104 family)